MSAIRNDADDCPDLGVLFVHGIGRQSPGETLVQFGDPIVHWLREWSHWATKRRLEHLNATKRGPTETTGQTGEDEPASAAIEVGDAVVKGSEAEPAHAEVRLRYSKRENLKQRWLFAESCWANAFVTPTFSDLAYWGLVVYPWTNASHFGAQMRRMGRHIAGPSYRGTSVKLLVSTVPMIFVVFAWAIVSVLVSIAVVSFLLLLLVLAIPPIPSVRSMLLRVQQSLANSLGDSYILVASAIQRASIVARMRRDLAWLVARRCKRIAIVAHSQGAAVAHEGLSQPIADLPKDTLFITLGSGIGKLRDLDRAIEGDMVKQGWIPIFGLGLCVASLEFFGVLNLLPFVERSTALGLICASFAPLFWLGGAMAIAGQQRPPSDLDPKRRGSPGYEWRDYYASDDPVSNGPLLDAKQSFAESMKVHNRGALWSDHTTYWKNRDQFVASIVADLSRFTGVPLCDLLPKDPDRLRAAAKRRTWRVKWLVGARIAIASVAGLVLFMRRGDLPRWGSSVLERIPFADTVIGWMFGDILGAGPLAHDPVAQLVAGCALVLATAVLVYHALFGLWQIWTALDTRALLRRTGYGAEVPYWWFVFAAMATTVAGVLVAWDWSPEHPQTSWVVTTLTLMSPGFLGGVLVFCLRIGRNSFATPRRRESVFVPTMLQSTAAGLATALPLAVLLAGNWTKWIQLSASASLVVIAVLLIGFAGAVIMPRRAE